MNVGSGGGAAAAPAAGGAAAGGAAAAEEAPKEEEKEEGESTFAFENEVDKVIVGHVLTILSVQRRRSRTRTWALVFSTKWFTIRDKWRTGSGIQREWNCILRWRLRLV